MRTRVHSLPFLFIKRHGLHFNGALYWDGYHLPRPQHATMDWEIGWRERDAIFRFDVDEKFEEISFPQFGQDEEYDFFHIEVFNGALYLSLSCYNIEHVEYRLWKMEQDSWILAFVVVVLDGPSEYDLLLIKACEDGKISGLFSRNLILNDPKTKKVEILDQVVTFIGFSN